MKSPRWLHAGPGLAVALATACLPGCALVGWTVAQFAPPQKVEARFEPPEGRTFLVLVEDAGDAIGYNPFQRTLSDKLSQQLCKHDVAGRTLSYGRLIQLRSARPNYWRMTPAQIGSELGADYVLRVRIERFSLRAGQDSPIWGGRLRATVALIDTASGLNAWPKDRLAYSLPTVELPATPDTSSARQVHTSQMLAAAAADKIAKLFYDHKVPVQEDTRTPDQSYQWGDEDSQSW